METLYIIWLSGTVFYGIDYVKWSTKHRAQKILEGAPNPASAFFVGLFMAMVSWPILVIVQILKAIDMLPDSFKKALDREASKNNMLASNIYRTNNSDNKYI